MVAVRANEKDKTRKDTKCNQGLGDWPLPALWAPRRPRQFGRLLSGDQVEFYCEHLNSIRIETQVFTGGSFDGGWRYIESWPYTTCARNAVDVDGDGQITKEEFVEKGLLAFFIC